jgi:3-methyladenine DNA glycosylase/8-oxoguanine DNA glycosylase
MESLYGEGTDRREMVDRAKRWKPHRSTASLYLWRAVE